MSKFGVFRPDETEAGGVREMSAGGAGSDPLILCSHEEEVHYSRMDLSCSEKKVHARVFAVRHALAPGNFLNGGSPEFAMHAMSSLRWSKNEVKETRRRVRFVLLPVSHDDAVALDVVTSAVRGGERRSAAEVRVSAGLHRCARHHVGQQIEPAGQAASSQQPAAMVVLEFRKQERRMVIEA